MRLDRWPFRAWPHALSLVLFTLVLSSRAFALSKDDILLYAPFDGSTNAAMAKGNPKAVVQGKAEFTEGKFGQGYLSGRRGNELAFESKGNIDPDAGTVALWVKPLGWYEKDPWMRFWFRAGEAAEAGGKGEGTFLWLYKYLSSVPLYWLVQQTYFQRSATYVGGSDIYRSGEWTHIAATWCGPVMRLYANGRWLGTARTPSPRVLRNFGTHFYVGGESWTAKGDQSEKPDSVIDELYVFRRPLTLAEIRDLAAKGKETLAASETTRPASLEIESAYFPSDDQLKVRLMINGRHPGDTQGLVTNFAIENVDTASLARPDLVTRSVKEVNSQEILDCKDLKPGKYRVIGSLQNNGQIASLVSADFEKPKLPEWLGNRIGMSPTVPAPWTSLILKDQSVECWGRKVEYANSIFPMQFTSKGETLLTRPIKLTAKIAGRSMEPTEVKFSWTKVTEQRASFTVEGKLSAVPLRADGWIEYDGFVWTHLAMPTTPGFNVESLKLEIPLRPDIATLQHGQVGGWSAGPNHGKVGPWHFALEGQPFLWLGNEEVGLQWSTGDNYCWENRERNKAIQLAPDQKECLLTITLIDRAVPLDRPLEYSFGLQATPVKPLPKGWRAYDLGMNGGWHKAPISTSIDGNRGKATGVGEAKIPVWAFWYQKWNVQNEASKKEGWLPGYPAAGPWTKELIEKTVAEDARPFLYTVPSWVWRGAPEYRSFHSEWNPDSPAALPFETTGASNTGVWRTVPSYQDWITWRWWKTLKDNPWLAESTAGIYNDVVQGFWGPDPRLDREGMMRVRHELLGAREIQKRMYIAFQKSWPHLIISNHQSADSIMSQLAFAHVYVTGENYSGNATLGKEEGYYHIIDLDSCRAELSGEHWGVPIMFLPEIQPSGAPFARVYGPEGVKPAEHLAGLLMVHDVIPWNANTNPVPLLRLAAIKENFGWDDDTHFIGYWKSSDLVKLTADSSPVVVSIYRRPGKVMFAVMNNSDKDATVTLTPDWAKLGITEPKELTDAYTVTGIPDAPMDLQKLGSDGVLQFKEPRTQMTKVVVPVVDHQVTFPVTKRNFRILVIQ